MNAITWAPLIVLSSLHAPPEPNKMRPVEFKPPINCAYEVKYAVWIPSEKFYIYQTDSGSLYWLICDPKDKK